jgi:ribose 5-phosphate isomerase A
VSGITDQLKREAALAALAEIRDGMIVGLGSGSTAAIFIQELGKAGLRVLGIPTSEESAKIARASGVQLTTFKEHADIDVTVDGADEVSAGLDLTKGLGGALVREKIVAHASRRVVIIVDETKMVEKLGMRTVIPVEVIPLAVPRLLLQLSGMAVREKDGRQFVSDNGNAILDWKRVPVEDPAALEKQLKSMTGVVDSGIFAGIADLVIVARVSGIQTISRP